MPAFGLSVVRHQMALHALLDHECCIFGKKNAAFDLKK